MSNMGCGFILGAILLGITGRQGWGWMIFGAILCIPGGSAMRTAAPDDSKARASQRATP